MAINKKPGLAVYAFLSIFLLVGLLAIGFGCWNLWRSLRCASWPTTAGVVVSAQMKSHQGNKGSTTYSAEIGYHYAVAGLNFTGDRLAFGAMSASSGYAQNILSRYPVGQKVTVHYSPDDPHIAVLETGIHGGTWICFGLGTAFTLAAIMFFQVFRAAGKAQTAAAQSSSIQTRPDGTITMNKPPALMGVLFILMGSPLFFVGSTGGAGNGTPSWVIYAAGGMFVGCGCLLLALRFELKFIANLLKVLVVAALLAIFHWVSFGAGERLGTRSTPFSTEHGVNVRTPFAIFTVIMDLALLAGWGWRLVKRFRK
jgi:hypothetical protein